MAQPASCRAFHWRLCRVAAGVGPRPAGRDLGSHLGGSHGHECPALVHPLTTDELVSLERISVVTTDVLIPVTHVEKLLATGYVQQSASGLVLTHIGVELLDRERVKKEPN